MSANEDNRKSGPNSKRNKGSPMSECSEQDAIATNEKGVVPAESGLPTFVRNQDGDVEVHVGTTGSVTSLFGNCSKDAAMAFLYQCANISGNSEHGQCDKNHALAFVDGIDPQDPLEAMLATQMASVHIAAMRHSSRLASSETFGSLEMNERILNKLNRTFVAQMEALRKHRHGGKQSVVVKHVTVNDGGQAIMGAVNRGREGANDDT